MPGAVSGLKYECWLGPVMQTQWETDIWKKNSLFIVFYPFFTWQASYVSIIAAYCRAYETTQ